MTSDSLPQLIQGGMGIGVSNWRLAKAVSSLGHLGVVSGTAMDVVLARRLQQGDPGGHMLRALGHFPQQDVVAPLIARYYPPDGIPVKEGYRSTPMSRLEMPKETEALLMVANFVDVFLARENHSGIVGINLMEKIQLPTLAVLYGAMLAGVDYVLIGAGIPNHIPAILDALAAGGPATLKIDVVGAAEGSSYTIFFDPKGILGREPADLEAASLHSHRLLGHPGSQFVEKSPGENHRLHRRGQQRGRTDAPPRGQMQLNARGEPIYGPRDLPDLERFRQLGYPFWLAGSYWGPGMLDNALEMGATGIQVGTPFAFCEESGVALGVKQQVLRKVRDGGIEVFTDPLASPTGFPFKIVGLEGSASSPEVEQKRSRVCDIGLLRQAYAKPDGTVGYRCASEDAGDYVRKGGKPESTAGRKCICNGLLSTIGLGQTTRSGVIEPPLVTAGDSLAELKAFLRPDSLSYSAADVIHILTSAVSCRADGS